MKRPAHAKTRRRRSVLAALALGVPMFAMAQAPAAAPIERIGVFSLLGDSVRVVARELQEVRFRTARLDESAGQAAQAAILARHPAARVSQHVAPEPIVVDEQRSIGNEASRSGALPAWIETAAREQQLGHVLLVTSHVGPMEFKTGLSQVVGNERVAGVGFYVSAEGRTKNTATGAVATGYLAPFVQLRVVLIDMANRKVLGGTTLSEGYIVGPPVAEALDPWQFLSLPQKAQALQGLVTSNVGRGTTQVMSGP